MSKRGQIPKEIKKRRIRKAKWLGATNSEVAYLYLEANPYQTGCAFYTNEDFMYALRARFGISNGDAIRSNQRCRCQKHNDMFIDEFGEHYCSGCPFYGSRQQIHDKIKYAVVDCAKIAEAPVEMEVTGFLRDENDPNDNGKQRPDAIVKIPYQGAGMTTCVVEVGVANTIEGTKSGQLVISQRHRVQAGIMAARTFRNKLNKYGESARRKGASLKVISVETSGTMHADSLRFIKKLAQLAAERKPELEYYEIKRYMLMKISIALFSSIGSVISRRINAANNHSVPTIEEYRSQTERILQSIAPAQ